MEDWKAYEDIIHLSHHVSTKHPQMSIRDRAAQFAPFAALTGHEEALKETARMTNQRIELDENQKVELDRRIQLIMEHLDENPRVKIIHYIEDEKKEGGSYQSDTGNVTKINSYEKYMVLDYSRVIYIEDILEIEIEEGEGYE